MPLVLTFISFATAATLPTECPDVATGEEVAALRAEIVAPAVLSVTGQLYDLRDDYGDDACPAEDGVACTAATGVAFAGTLETTRTGYDSEPCWWDDVIWDGTEQHDAVADAMSAGPLGGASLRADGQASTTHTTEACREYIADGADWTGALAVDGPWKGLEDDAIVGHAWSTEAGSTYGDEQKAYGWEGTSGACAWTAAATNSTLGERADHGVSGTVSVGGMTVTYAWLLGYLCTPDCGWTAVHSSTWVDGVRTGDASWAADEYADEARPWVDADDDGWAPPADCDDADPAVYPLDDTWDCDGDGYSGSARRALAEDCDDADPAIRPDAEDVACDGVNSDCGYHDEDCDGDGYTTERGDDCDDYDAAVNPGAEDLVIDGVDADCNGVDGVDDDADGYDAAVDCNDYRPGVHPGALDVCGDDEDRNCDGLDGIGCAEAADLKKAGEAPPAAETKAAGGCGSGGAALLLPFVLTFRRWRRKGPLLAPPTLGRR